MIPFKKFISNLKKPDDGYQKVFLGNVKKYERLENAAEKELDKIEKQGVRADKEATAKYSVKEDADRKLDSIGIHHAFGKASATPKGNEHIIAHDPAVNHAVGRKYHNVGDTPVYAMHQQLTKHYTFAGADHQKSRNAINNYTSAGYCGMNRALYDGEDTHHPSHEYHNDIRDMKAVLTKHTTPDHMTVHTGIKRDPRSFQEHSDHIKMHMPAFTSTTIRPPTALGFSEKHHILSKPDHTGYQHTLHTESHVLHIDVPKGSHGAYVDHHSASMGEHEFTLHPGAKLHVDSTPEKHVEGPEHKAHVTYHWKAKLVHDGIKEV